MSDTAKKKIFNFSLFARIFHYVKPYRWQFISSVVLAILLAFITPLRPHLIQLTIDKATGKATEAPLIIKWLFYNTDLNDATKFIIAITIFQVIFIFVETALRFLFSFLTSWLGQSVVKDMRVSIFKKILGLNLKQFDTTPIGTLTTRTINDIESINDIFSDGLIQIIADFLSIIVVLITMFATDWRLTLIALVPFPLLILATYYFKESVNKSFIKVRNATLGYNIPQKITKRLKMNFLNFFVMGDNLYTFKKSKTLADPELADPTTGSVNVVYPSSLKLTFGLNFGL